MSDQIGSQTRWIAPLTPQERRLYRAEQEMMQIRGQVIEARRQAAAAAGGRMSGVFTMNAGAMRSAYTTLHEQYREVVSLRESVHRVTGSFDEKAVGGQIEGAVVAAGRAKLALKGYILAEVTALETEIVTVLNGMYGSYHGSAATDADQAAELRGAGRSGSGPAAGSTAAPTFN